MIRFACPSCGIAASAPEDCAGRRTACRRCRQPIIVPYPNPPAPGAAPGAEAPGARVTSHNLTPAQKPLPAPRPAGEPFTRPVPRPSPAGPQQASTRWPPRARARLLLAGVVVAIAAGGLLGFGAYALRTAGRGRGADTARVSLAGPSPLRPQAPGGAGAPDPANEGGLFPDAGGNASLPKQEDVLPPTNPPPLRPRVVLPDLTIPAPEAAGPDEEKEQATENGVRAKPERPMVQPAPKPPAPAAHSEGRMPQPGPGQPAPPPRPADDEAKPYAAIDRYALAATPDREASLEALAAYLSRPCKTQRDKARAIYRWVTDRIAYDVEGLYAGRPGDSRPRAVLQRRTAVCEGYSSLFLGLSQLMGLRAARVVGYAKGIGYTYGTPIRGENHAWVVVAHEGGLGLVDPTWGAGYVNGESFVKRFTGYYFLVPPDELIFTHLPADPRCQLLARPISRGEFERQPTATHLLFQFGVSAQSAREAAAGSAGELVEVSEHPFAGMRLVKAPLGKYLRAGSEYEFRFESKDCVQMAVFNEGPHAFLTQEGGVFYGRVRPRRGVLFVAGQRAGDANRFASILRYVVE